MASSNRHWPSMFKSKPSCTTTAHHQNHHHHQWQHDMNMINHPALLSSGGCQRPPYSSSSVPGGEEKSPEPKPRWNPKPEQIRILEAIFNSGMVNPPRDEIRKIRSQLQEYGQVGDANVFYWFQNRKSRSKHKNRQLQTSTANKHNHHHHNAPYTTTATSSAVTAPSSSSSSSDKSSPNSADKLFTLGSSSDVLNSPTASVNQTYFQAAPAEFYPESFFFPAPATTTTTSAFTSQGFCFPELSSSVHVPTAVDLAVGSCSGGLNLLSDLVMMNHGPPPKKVDDDDDEKLRMQQQQLISYSVAAATAPVATHSSSRTATAPPSTFTIPSAIHQILGVGESAGPPHAHPPVKSTVFINDEAFEVAVGPFNLREAFGDDAVLFHSTGHPVLTNDWGVTLQPLQHGGFYYLMRTLIPINSSEEEETQLI